MKTASYVGTLVFWNLSAVAILLLLLLRVPVVAQSVVTGEISGTVADPNGAVVTGAAVALTARLTGVTLSTVTNSAGLYFFPLVKPGSYSLSVTQPGFSNAKQNVEVVLGQTTSVNLKLTLGNVAETIQVSAESGLTQTEDANVTTTVPDRQIENLPSPGRDLTNFAQTAPGILMNTSSGGGYGNFSAFGLPASSNLFSINGADYNTSGASNLLLGSNEIQEMSVVTIGYTGQYGRHAGAQVSYSTTSGTNLLHGDASYFWTGRALDANDWFNNFNGTPRPFQNNNQWTASLGGPIKKKKLFFFVNTEGLRYVFGTSQQIFLPAPLFQSELLARVPTAAVPFYNKMFNLYNAAPGVKRAALSPESCGSYSPVAPAIGTSCLTTYRDSSTNGNREWLLSARVDLSLRQNDTLFLRWKMDRGYQPTYTDPVTSVFNIGSNQPITEGQLNYTHTFSPTFVNSVVFSVVHTSFIFLSPNLSKALTLFPYILRSTDSSLTPLGPGSGSFATFPQGGEGPGFQLIDDASWAVGHHTLKSGLNLIWARNTDYVPGTQPFPAVSTSLADFAVGLGDLVNQNFAVAPRQHGSWYALGVYGQDQWAVSPKLKLTLTFRGDYNPVGVCRERCASFTNQPFNSPTFSHSAEVPYNQMMVSSKHVLRGSELIVLQPRFGFAFSPWAGSTLIRGGVGLFMDTQGLGSYFNINFPSVNRFYVPGPFALAPEMAGSAASSVAACNTAFTSNFHSGGTVNSYLNAHPSCGLPSLFDVNQKFKSPKYLEWNLELQHSIGTSTSLSLNYVGNYGYDEVSFLSAANGFGFASLPASPPDVRVAFVGQFANGAHSNYNGLTASLNQHMWKGFEGAAELDVEPLHRRRIKRRLAVQPDQQRLGSIRSRVSAMFKSCFLRLRCTNKFDR